MRVALYYLWQAAVPTPHLVALPPRYTGQHLQAEEKMAETKADHNSRSAPFKVCVLDLLNGPSTDPALGSMHPHLFSKKPNGTVWGGGGASVWELY